MNVIKNGKATEEEQVKAAKIATIVFGVCAVGLGILFKGQNVAFKVGPRLRDRRERELRRSSCRSSGRTSRPRARSGRSWSARSSCSMIVLEDGVGRRVRLRPPSPHQEPGDLPGDGGLRGVVVSLLTPEREAQEKFEDEKLRTYLGVGAE